MADTPDFTYTANTKENVIYKAVGKSVVDDYTWNVYVDGAEQAGDDLAPANDKDTDYAYTAKGATTEIYVDDVNDTVTVVMINYYMAEVTKLKDGEVTVRVLSDLSLIHIWKPLAEIALHQPAVLCQPDDLLRGEQALLSLIHILMTQFITAEEPRGMAFSWTTRVLTSFTDSAPASWPS